MLYSIFVIYCLTYFDMYSKHYRIVQIVLLIIQLILVCILTFIFDSFMNLGFINNTYAFSRPKLDKFHYVRHGFKIIMISIALKPDQTFLEKSLFLSGLSLIVIVILSRALTCKNFFNSHMDKAIIFLTVVRTQYLISCTITVIAVTFTYKEFIVLQVFLLPIILGASILIRSRYQDYIIMEFYEGRVKSKTQMEYCSYIIYEYLQS